MKVWCARRKRTIFVERTCLECRKAFKCTRFGIIMVTHGIDGVTKNKKLRKRLKKLLDIFAFIREDKQPRLEGW